MIRILVLSAILILSHCAKSQDLQHTTDKLVDKLKQAAGKDLKALDEKIESLLVESKLRGDNSQIARAYDLKGRIGFLNGDTNIKAYSDSAIMFFEQGTMVRKDSLELCGVYLRKGGALNINRKRVESLVILFKGLRMSYTLNFPLSISRFLRAISNVYYGLEQFDLATEYHNKEVTLVDSLDLVERQPESVLNQGVYAGFNGDFEAAERYLFKALRLSQSAGDIKTIYACYQSIGSLYHSKQSFELSNKYIDSSMICLESYPWLDAPVRNKILMSVNHLWMGNKQIAYDIITSVNDFGETSDESLFLQAKSAVLDSLDYFEELSYTQKRYIALRDSLYNTGLQDAAQKNDRIYRVRELAEENSTLKTQYSDTKTLKDELENSIIFTNRVILIALIVLLILSGVIYLRYRYKKSALQIQMSELKRKVLLAQMNPHFTFNTMNSIQNYIDKGDKEEASYYISKFASLMRNILHFSDKESISFKDEVVMLQTYLALEQMRQPTMSFSIVLDDSIDQDFDRLPPMMIQPFIENAIVHGVGNLIDTSGDIQVKFRKEKNLVVCTVIDNGVGREKAMTIQARNKIKKESKGLKIVEERLLSLKKERKLPLGYVFADNQNINYEISGTKVKISLPLM